MGKEEDLKEAVSLEKQLEEQLEEQLSKKKKISSNQTGGLYSTVKGFATFVSGMLLLIRGKPVNTVNEYYKQNAPKHLLDLLEKGGKNAKALIDASKSTTGGKSRKKYRGGNGSNQKSNKKSSRKSSRKSSKKSNRKNSESDDKSDAKSEDKSDDKSEEKVKNGVYTGDKNEKGLYSGQGKMEYPNGDVFEGEWKNNMRDGKGKITFVNQSTYDGMWSKDEINGQGTYKYFNEDVYEGVFNKGIRSGHGKMSYANGDVYTGNWKKNKRDGEGKLTYKNGDYFIGNWEKDKRDGEGKLMSSTGTVIEEGDYEDDSLPMNFSKIDISKINSVVGQVNVKVDKVINSENVLKFKEIMNKAQTSLPTLHEFNDTNWKSVINYGASLYYICSAVYSVYFGGCEKLQADIIANDKLVTDKKTLVLPAFCVALNAILPMITRHIETTGNTFTDASKILVGTYSSILSTMSSILGYIKPIAIGGFALFVVFILYATWTYINLPDEDHAEMRKSLRKKNRKK
jgi:hypothetical protein